MNVHGKGEHRFMDKDMEMDLISPCLNSRASCSRGEDRYQQGKQLNLGKTDSGSCLDSCSANKLRIHLSICPFIHPYLFTMRKNCNVNLKFCGN